MKDKVADFINNNLKNKTGFCGEDCLAQDV